MTIQKMKVKFSFDKTVAYWNHEQGSGVQVDGTMDMGHWGSEASYMNEEVAIDSLEDVRGILVDILHRYELPTHYFAIMDDGRMSINVIENGNADVLDESGQDDAIKNSKQMYIADYSINIEIQHVYEPDVSQIQKMFPKAEY